MQVKQQTELVKALKNEITHLENELLRAEFYIRKSIGLAKGTMFEGIVRLLMRMALSIP